MFRHTLNARHVRCEHVCRGDSTVGRDADLIDRDAGEPVNAADAAAVGVEDA
jgi:hypothetical protein